MNASKSICTTNANEYFQRFLSSWKEKVLPAFEELHEIMSGNSALSHEEIVSRLQSRRPEGEQWYNPILRYLKGQTVQSLGKTYRELPTEGANEITQTLEEYKRRWNQFCGDCIRIYGKTGAKLQSQYSKSLSIATRLFEKDLPEDLESCRNSFVQLRNAFDLIAQEEAECPRLKCGQGVNVVDKKDGRYSELDEDLAVCAKVKPCIFRYNKLSEVIVRGLTLASEGKPDFEVWKSDWLTAALQLLGQNPCPRGVGFIERQQLLDGIAPIIRQLQNLMQLQQSADPDMTFDEFDAFYKSYHDAVIEGCVSKSAMPGKCVISIDYAFLTHEDGRYGWMFDPIRIQHLTQHCSGVDSIEKYRQMSIPKNREEWVQAMNLYDSENIDHRTMSIILSASIDPARRIVTLMEDESNLQRHLLIDDVSNIEDILKPFFGSYYKPFTRTKPIPLEDDKLLDANDYLEELISLVDRLVSAIGKLTHQNESARRVSKLWREVLSLYRSRLSRPNQQLTRESQEEYYKLFCSLTRSIVECAPIVESIENGKLPRYYKIEESLAVYAKSTPNLNRFDSVCKLILSGIDIACEGRPDFDVHKTRWLSAALQLLCENPFTITNELATLHDLSIIKMVFEPLLPRLDTLVSLYQRAHAGAHLPDFLQSVYDIIEENTKDKGDGRKFYYEDSILFDEDLWGWRFNCRIITRLSQYCTANDAVQYFKKATIVANTGIQINVERYTRDSLYVDYYHANELMFRESGKILESLLSQIEGDASMEQKCSVLDNTSVIIEALKPLNNTYYLPYSKYREVFLEKTQTDLDVPKQCEKYLTKVDQFIVAICKFAGGCPAARQLKQKYDGVISSYRLRLKHSELPLSCSDQRAHLKKITDMLANILLCNAAVRTGKATEEEFLNDPKVVTKVEELITREHEVTRSTILSGVKDILLGWFPWTTSKKEGSRSPRSEQLENKARLTKYLREILFSMLGMSYEDQINVIDGLNGKKLSDATRIRQNTVGDMVNLKWRKNGHGVDSLLQLLYITCTDMDAFRVFEEAAKKSHTIWDKKSDEELYAALKGVLKAKLLNPK